MVIAQVTMTDIMTDLVVTVLLAMGTAAAADSPPVTVLEAEILVATARLIRQRLDILVIITTKDIIINRKTILQVTIVEDPILPTQEEVVERAVFIHEIIMIVTTDL